MTDLSYHQRQWADWNHLVPPYCIECKYHPISDNELVTKQIQNAMQTLETNPRINIKTSELPYSRLFPITQIFSIDITNDPTSLCNSLNSQRFFNSVECQLQKTEF